MKLLKYGSLALGISGLTQAGAMAGGHLHKHHTYYTSTTTTTGAPVVLAPAAQPVYYVTGAATTAPAVAPPTQAPAAVPVVFTQAQPVAAPTVYYYAPAQATPSPVAPVAPAPVAAPTAPVGPSLLAPMATVMPVANPSGQAASPFAMPVGGTAEQSRSGRIFNAMRQFAANSGVDRNTLAAAVRQIGLGFLRAELAQYGLGGLVPNPSPNDQNVIEDMVNRIVGEKFGSVAGNAGSPGGAESGSGDAHFVFNGAVTLSFPNVQSVQIQTPNVTTSTSTTPVQNPNVLGDGKVSDAAAPVAPVAPAPAPAPPATNPK